MVSVVVAYGEGEGQGRGGEGRGSAEVMTFKSLQSHPMLSGTLHVLPYVNLHCIHCYMYYCCYGNPFPQIHWLVLAQPPPTSSMMPSSHSHTQSTPQPSPSKLETWATRMGLKGSPPVTHPLPPSRTCPITAICTSFQRGATVRRPCLRGSGGC